MTPKGVSFFPDLLAKYALTREDCTDLVIRKAFTLQRQRTEALLKKYAKPAEPKIVQVDEEDAEAIPPKPEKKGEPSKKKEPIVVKKDNIFGFSVTAVLRWMGKQGYSSEEATKVLNHFRVDISPATVKIQVKAGSKGERGAPATLSPKEADEIKGLLGVKKKSKK